jgi:hypothetical protein
MEILALFVLLPKIKSARSLNPGNYSAILKRGIVPRSVSGI